MRAKESYSKHAHYTNIEVFVNIINAHQMLNTGMHIIAHCLIYVLNKRSSTEINVHQETLNFE